MDFNEGESNFYSTVNKVKTNAIRRQFGRRSERLGTAFIMLLVDVLQVCVSFFFPATKKSSFPATNNAILKHSQQAFVPVIT